MAIRDSINAWREWVCAFQPSDDWFYVIRPCYETRSVETVRPSIVHFVSLFATLLAIINPLEAIPVFLNLLEGKSSDVHRSVARKSCLYALGLMLFFLLFGTLLLHVFGVSLSMIRVVGGIILTRIGFQLFAPSPSGNLVPTGGSGGADGAGIAFIPMAMPIMFGPGGIATLIGMAATMHLSRGGAGNLRRQYPGDRGDNGGDLSVPGLRRAHIEKNGAERDRRSDADHGFLRIGHGDGPVFQRDCGVSSVLWHHGRPCRRSVTSNQSTSPRFLALLAGAPDRPPTGPSPSKPRFHPECTGRRRDTLGIVTQYVQLEGVEWLSSRACRSPR